MPKYSVYHSARFDKELEKLDSDFKIWLEKIEDQLVDNPYTGDPIDAKWFREKKYKNYRVYFVVYDDLTSVFMVGMSKKKDQQKVINTIRLLMEFFKEEIKGLSKNH